MIAATTGRASRKMLLRRPVVAARSATLAFALITSLRADLLAFAACNPPLAARRA